MKKYLKNPFTYLVAVLLVWNVVLTLSYSYIQKEHDCTVDIISGVGFRLGVLINSINKTNNLAELVELTLNDISQELQYPHRSICNPIE